MNSAFQHHRELRSYLLQREWDVFGTLKFQTAGLISGYQARRLLRSYWNQLDRVVYGKAATVGCRIQRWCFAHGGSYNDNCHVHFVARSAFDPDEFCALANTVWAKHNSATAGIRQNWITPIHYPERVAGYPNFSSGYFDLILTDECHRSIYGKWSGALKHFDGVQIGLTATPCVADPDTLGDEEDGKFIRDTLRFFEVDKPTFKYSMQQAIEEGHLVPYQIYKAKTVKTAAEGGFEVKRSEIDWSALDAESRAQFEELFGEDDKIMVDPSALERTFTIPERNRALVREFREVMDNGYVAKDGRRRAPLIGKTIVFAVTKRHAETLAQMFDEHYADKKPDPATRYADYVVSDMGNDSTVDAIAKIKRFKDEAYPKILVSVNMLDTGFDAPEVVNLVMARFTKSSILYQQMRGRGTRRADHIFKNSFTMFDFVGVTDYHNDDESGGEGGFVVAKAPTDKGKTPRKLLMLDINDHIDPASRDWVTVDAAGNPVRSTAAEQRGAKLSIKFEAWLAENSFHSDQMRLLRMIEQQIKADADDIAAWEDWRFTNPPFASVGGIQRARQTFGGAEGLDRMIASLNRAVFDDAEPLDTGETAAATPQREH